MNEPSDDYIISLFSESDTRSEGFKLLLKKYKEKVYWHVRTIVVSHDDANDVVQNVFIKIWENIDNFRGDSKLYTWIYRIATNEAINFINKKRSNLFISIDELQENFLDNLEADPYFKGSEIERKLIKAINTLPPKQKLVFYLRYYTQMPYKDMAEVLNTPINTLKSSYHQAKKKIKKFFLSID
ncbi:MAG: RNA polymerase sigma factor [Bacteroidales bacterium]|jgi:RNA polymerase sigma factor (sigma-70 family)|nr:RNA polymerase sigma factor [Bacteroidales bacterium]MDD3755824.1 RNA polymerase sigma factor [Bacteroidales bacterium]MDI9576466.1 RNA polymerase sigma factor [Bacteroidota bacterium]MDY0401117.1 RNA polymerase sigma factor [Bacteroidales bacterium]HHW60203.1 RNA polymerase sigma factor [Bacteroidales bacterium]